MFMRISFRRIANTSTTITVTAVTVSLTFLTRFKHAISAERNSTKLRTVLTVIGTKVQPAVIFYKIRWVGGIVLLEHCIVPEFYYRSIWYLIR